MKRLLFILALATASLFYLHTQEDTTKTKASSKSNETQHTKDQYPLNEEYSEKPELTSARWQEISLSEGLPSQSLPRIQPKITADTLRCQLPSLEPLETAAGFQFKEVKNVKPPFPKIQVPHEQIVLLPTDFRKEQSIRFEGGTELTIPGNALCLKDGSEVTEPVRLGYMLLDNAYEVMLSGIPMTYDSAGSQNLFQTAGMFRLEAKTLSGKEVVLKEGNAMRLTMPTADNSGRYNDYRFDEQEGKWTFQNTSANPVNIAITSRDSVKLRTVNEMFYDADFAYTHAKKSRRAITRLCLNHRRGHLSCYHHEPFKVIPKRIKTVYFKTSAVRAKEDQEGMVYFKAEKSKYYWAFNPEWKVFERWNFKAKDWSELKSFRNQYKVNKRYNDLRLIWEGGNEVLFLLKHNNGLDSLRAEAWDSEGRYAPVVQRSFARRYKRYSRELKKREECHEAYLKRVTRFSGRTRMGGAREIKLPDFGIYNCDRTYLMASPKSYRSLSFTAADGRKLNPSSLLVLDDIARGAFYLSAIDFKACRVGTSAVLITGRQDKMYACSGKHLERNGRFRGGKTLRLEEVPEEVEEYEALQQWLEDLPE